MEEITIRGIERKGNLVIVKYNMNQEATMNTGWQQAEVDFMVGLGIGGKCSVEVEQKGKYVNITKVDMNSGKATESVPTIPDAKELVPQEAKGSRDDAITAAWMVKSACEVAANVKGDFGSNKEFGQYLCETLVEINGARKYALSLL